MKAEFTRFGPKHDYRGAHVTLRYQGRDHLGTIVTMRRNDWRCFIECEVKYFCGDPWPIKPALSALNILERHDESDADPYDLAKRQSGF